MLTELFIWLLYPILQLKLSKISININQAKKWLNTTLADAQNQVQLYSLCIFYETFNIESIVARLPDDTLKINQNTKKFNNKTSSSTKKFNISWCGLSLDYHLFSVGGGREKMSYLFSKNGGYKSCWSNVKGRVPNWNPRSGDLLSSSSIRMQQLLFWSFLYNDLISWRNWEINGGYGSCNIELYPMVICWKSHAVGSNFVGSITYNVICTAFSNYIFLFEILKFELKQFRLSWAYIPFAAIRSAPTTTAFTRPACIRAATAESAIKVAGIWSWTSSKAVSLEPCKYGNEC